MLRTCKLVNFSSSLFATPTIGENFLTKKAPFKNRVFISWTSFLQVYEFSVWKWKYFYMRKAYCAITKEIACVLAGSLLKNKMWISISSFRHVLVCSWFFSSASHEYRHERKSLRLFRQKALYSSWSLPLQPRRSECCGRHWRKFNKSSFRGRRHICGLCDLSKTLPNIKLYRWWFFMLSYRWPANS